MQAAACGTQFNHALFLEVDVIVTAIAPITMIAALMFHFLLGTNTVVSKSMAHHNPAILCSFTNMINLLLFKLLSLITARKTAVLLVHL